MKLKVGSILLVQVVFTAGRISAGTVNVDFDRTTPDASAFDSVSEIVHFAGPTTHKDFTVTISTEFAGVIDSATLCAPNRTRVSLTVSQAGAFNRLEIPIREEWRIIKSERKRNEQIIRGTPNHCHRVLYARGGIWQGKRGR